MRLFKTNKKENEQIRGIPDGDLKRLDNIKLISVGLARLMETVGCEDEELIAELYRRGKSNL